VKRINLNTVLLVLGLLAEFGPDIAGASTALAGSGVAWLLPVARVLGVLALLLASLPRIITRLRPMLAAINLASPPAPPKDSP
jgi:hypothetical protein